MALPRGPKKRVSLPLIIVGLILAGIGAFAVCEYGQYTTITCTKAENGHVDCDVVARWLNLGPASRGETISDVASTRVEIACSTEEDNQYRCYRDVLVIENEERTYKIGSPYFSEDTAAEASAQIDAFVRQPRAVPLVIDCQNSFYTILGFVCVALPFLSLGGLALWAGFAGLPPRWFRTP